MQTMTRAEPMTEIMMYTLSVDVVGPGKIVSTIKPTTTTKKKEIKKDQARTLALKHSEVRDCLVF